MLRIGALVLATAALALFAVGCGDDDDGGEPLSIADYFDRLENASDEFNDRAEALGDEMDGRIDSAESINDVFEALEEGMNRYEDIFNDFEDAVDSLEPPAGVRELHDETLRALDAAEEATSDIAELASDGASATTADLDDAFESFEGALAPLQQACRDLQELADSEGLSVELGCPVAD